MPRLTKLTERHTTDELRELVKAVRSGTFHYDGRPKKSLDWASYNEAQLNEINDTLNLIKRFVNIASGRTPQKAQKEGPTSFPGEGCRQGSPPPKLLWGL